VLSWFCARALAWTGAGAGAGEEPGAGGDNPDGALIRYEFIELLVRIAKEKFLKPGTCPDIASSLEMLL
jgi:hypothetical protein